MIPAQDAQHPFLTYACCSQHNLHMCIMCILPLRHHVPHCRRLTPNFKVRVDVSYKHRCSFPLTLKAYVISQQEKDSVPEWVPDDFLDPDLPQVSGLQLQGHTSCL